MVSAPEYFNIKLEVFGKIVKDHSADFDAMVREYAKACNMSFNEAKTYVLRDLLARETEELANIYRTRFKIIDAVADSLHDIVDEIVTKICSKCGLNRDDYEFSGFTVEDYDEFSVTISNKTGDVKVYRCRFVNEKELECHEVE